MDSNVSFTPATKAVNIADMRTVAIFPFADYTQVQPYGFSPNMGVNQRVLEEVTDYFVSHGVKVVVQEDVNGLLLSEGTMLVMKKETDASRIESELRKQHHTPLMQQNMVRMIRDDYVWGTGPGKSGGQAKPEGFTAGISSSMLKKIGLELGADKVLRGRIIDYTIVKNKSFNPANGVVAVALGGLLEGMGAFAYRESYERGLPPPSYKEKEIYDERGGSEFGMMVPPEEKVSDVQIRLYLQNVESGEVLWSNRAYVRYSPESNMMFAANHPQRMLDSAVREAVQALMADLFKPARVAT